MFSVNKKMEEVKLVASGGGAASIACIDLLVSMGLSRDNVYVCDSRGVVYKGRVDGMNEYKEKYAQDTLLRTLDDAIADADIFMGLSGPGEVPLPAAAWLFGSALIGLVAVARRKAVV